LQPTLVAVFLSLDLTGICDALEQHPWVATASARRKWPDEVVIAIEEESAIARWGEGRFLSNKGQVLAIGDASLPDHLPVLYGPDGLERRVMQQYKNFSQVLQPTGMKVKAFGMAARGNWQVTFEPELELVVGKEPIAKKLERFLLVWDKALQERKDAIEQIDLRYGNGLAVRWKQDKDTAPETGSTG
jgi:Cell division septal protein